MKEIKSVLVDISFNLNFKFIDLHLPLIDNL